MGSPANAEQIEHAIAAAHRALAADERSARTWHDLGVLYQMRGALGDSRAAFERAAELEPEFASAHNNLGNTYARLGDNERAVASYRRALECDPSLMPAHANAAVALHVLGRNTEALAHARQAIELDPTATHARITAAFVEGALNGYDVALTQLDALLAGAPENLSLLAARTYSLLRLERYAEAHVAAEGGLTLQPNAPSLLEALGCALRGLGRTDEALAAFACALAHGAERPGSSR